MPKIFLSYRRNDSGQIIGRIYDRLVVEYGESNVFKDVNSIKPGSDFRDVLDKWLKDSDVVIAVIGPEWLGEEENHQYRIKASSDYVRIEIEKSLLRKNARLIPVLVNNGKMPSPETMPRAIEDLCYLNAEVVRNDPDFHQDMNRLVSAIKEPLPKVRKKPKWSAVNFFIAIIAAIFIYLSQTPNDSIPSSTAKLLPDRALDTSSSIDIDTESLKQDIAKLLTQSEETIESNELTLSEYNSLLFYAKKLKDLDPNNTKIEPILSKASSYFEQAASQNISNNEFETARSNLSKSKELTSVFSLPGKERVRLSAKLKEAENVSKQVNRTLRWSNNLVLRPIPAGSFTMGNNEYKKEKPAHPVKIKHPFWMSETEVTFSQYDAYADIMNRPKPSNKVKGRNLDRANHPVVFVSWHNAKNYARWLSENNKDKLQCRLPSEAEWEYAARAETNSDYSWGNKAGRNNANCKDCGSKWDNKQPAPVASFEPNQFGLYDMHGNVWEWVEDQWNDNYVNAPTNGEPWKSGKAEYRVLRSGSWLYSLADMRSTARNTLKSSTKHQNIGFRIVCTTKQT